VIENSKVKANFDMDGNLINFQNISDSFVYYTTNAMSRSGLYLFGPFSSAKNLEFDDIKINHLNLPNTAQIVQIYLEKQKLQILKTYILETHPSSQHLFHLFTEIQAYTTEFIELNYRLQKSQFSKTSKFSAYIDDSLKNGKSADLRPKSQHLPRK
jgi:hypothetical protein